ncbi:RNA polymerase III transcription factor IIIC subunit-domain-containing protein [Cristinia sonorae]|uniref:RNA polymerase III transcription factor IIIC subunit-domain-containing protein n=1 Tax=Cristinia sonorae TaxID=1940300 RepID=A0A8K0UX59_9AGAR|nr:RNA polymerase III transcription factor IIIC subunit-domain-containing protein [Cristinia sonorae]
MNDSTPGAGPSNTVHDGHNTAPNIPAAVAPSHRLPPSHFYSIEYPGYVRPTSIPIALGKLGGPSQVFAAFQKSGSKAGSPLELNLRPNDPFSHPVAGEVLQTNNLLMKVVKRKRKTRGPDGEAIGEYTAEVVGSISKTARFRSMADYQYKCDARDPVLVLRSSMDKLDVDGIMKYSIPEEKEDYLIPKPTSTAETDMVIDPQLLSDSQQTESTAVEMKSNIRLFPPPLFSRQSVPHNYNFKANTASIVSTTLDESTGEEKKRLINRMRWKGYGPASVYYTDKDVPTTPTAAVEEQRFSADVQILERLKKLFEERPVWTRAAIFNQFEPLEVREIVNSKILLPLVSYVFQDGPWRDTQVRLGYDPRVHPEARFYQRLYFRNINKPIVRPSVIGRRQDGRNEIANARAGDAFGKEDRRSHIFDGVTVSETAAFQLCDIEDAMLKEMIEDDDDLRETCHERDGWYTSYQFDRIKMILRHKFFALLAGHVATREECEALLIPNEGAEKLSIRPAHRLRPGKHNMAKGALRPEDAAAQRLTAALEQRLKKASQR